MSLAPGVVFADHFEVERLAGQGGMGTVYRVRDRRTGRPAALKLLLARDGSTQDAERFTREAQLLAGLRHDGIVAHVAHGQTPEGQRYLVMEWLAGEDLAQRLCRAPLSIKDCVTLLERVTSALAAAHEQGIVHRDLKPTNIFLVDGDVKRAKLLDFGIARRLNSAQSVTHTGLVIGTPEYMAPEQARGSRDLTPSADIFALGCVLYECLAGQAPFAGEHIAAVLVRILFEEPAPLHARRPGVPASLLHLVDEMLRKDPLARPQDAAALSARLARLSLLGAQDEETLPPTLVGETLVAAPAGQEQHLFSVVLATARRRGDDAATPQPADSTEIDLERRHSIETVLASLSARAEWLLDGSLVVAVATAGSATDLVGHAARLALLIKERWPEAELALATGRGVVQGTLPVGEVVDRATRLLGMADAPADEPRPPSGVWLDEVSAGLLARRFTLSKERGRVLLSGDELSVDDTRPLLGKPTPCVGREQELTTLGAILTSCMDESEARVVLITAPAGIGKSRLRHEFLRRVRANQTNVTVVLGLADMMSAGAPYGILGQALRRLCGIAGSEPPELQRQRLTERLGDGLAADARQDVIEFLGELCGVPFPDASAVKLRAARQDPRIMQAQTTLALQTWIAAECRRGPLLLVIEDLHWGDALTVNALETALRECKDQPLMVLLLARPEVHGLFPRLGQGHLLKELPLGGLGKRACERLVQQVLGSDVPAAVLSRLSAQSEGNALYLEELIRAVGEGKGDALPQTVLAMLQARIGRLATRARQVLHAASVYGETFWSGGVAALLSGSPSADLEAVLDDLQGGELIERRASSRFDGELEYGFRHALIREAAYGLLTDEARPRLHELAAEYLERRSEPDPMIVAEHFHLAGASARAIPYFIRAAEQAFDGYDPPEAIARVDRGLAERPEGPALGVLLSIRTNASFWSGNTEDSYRTGHQALPLLGVGDRGWCMTMLCLISGAIALAKPQAEFIALVEQTMTAHPTEDARAKYAELLSFLVVMMSVTGQREATELHMRNLAENFPAHLQHGADVRVWTLYAELHHVMMLQLDPLRCLQVALDCLAAAEQLVDRRMAANITGHLGMARIYALGDASGEPTLRRALTLLGALNEKMAYVHNVAHLVIHLAERCDAANLPEIAAHIEYLNEHGGFAASYDGAAQCALAAVHAHAGRWAEAETAAARAIELMRHLPPFQMLGVAAMIRLRLRQDRGAEASAVAAEGLRLLDTMGGGGFAATKLRVAAAEALHAVGDGARARAELRTALAAIHRCADGITEPEVRTQYLEQVRDNARAHALARAWQVADPIA